MTRHFSKNSSLCGKSRSPDCCSTLKVANSRLRESCNGGFPTVPKWIVLCVCVLIVGGAVPVTGQVKVQPEADETTEDYIDIFLPAPRILRQHLKRAEKAIVERRYTEVVEALGAILNPQGEEAEDYAEDYFVNKPGQQGTLTSIKAQARRMLDGLPAEGRELYEIRDGPEAREMLTTVLGSGNLNSLNEITRKFFHTQAGYEAAMLLGRYHLDHGRPLAAAMCFKRVTESRSAIRYEPEASVMLATCWMHAGSPEKAEAVLVDLKKRMPRGRVVVRGEQIGLFDKAEEALPWLVNLVGTPPAASTSAATIWAMHRGDPTRNARSEGGMPLVTSRWIVPVSNDPSDEGIVQSIH